MADINFNGITMEYSAIEGMMDAETKAQILANNPNLSEQEILSAPDRDDLLKWLRNQPIFYRL